MLRKDVIVVGAGPAGLMAAGKAASLGMTVVLLERNSRPGRKLLITGKGRCNFTNDTDVDGLIAGIPGNGKFLYSAFSRFDSYDLREFFRGLGVESKTERGKRVFPASGISRDVLRALVTYVKKSGAKLQFNSRVHKVVVSGEKVQGVVFTAGCGKTEFMPCDAVVIATGGITYAATGSTGDGLRIAKELRHTVVQPRASLIPLETLESWPREVAGLTLRNVQVTLTIDGRKSGSELGEMLFTHYGVSGPIILSLSRAAASAMVNAKPGVALIIDMKPALSHEQLDARVLRDFAKHGGQTVLNSLVDLMPRHLIDIVLQEAGVSASKHISQVTREERLLIGKTLKELTLHIAGLRPDDEGIVTAGGVDVDEIDPRRMESKLVQGLYFAGEVIDVDGMTGGFNLQAAFSTGYLAGQSLAEGR
ncbi:MAG: NAD(P)/FAD-dependent oxidoreductase [Firmicutes bacterium]|nr:NAD(P)/FAD-dependent oxidoreductase [Bacillota bacterium]